RNGGRDFWPHPACNSGSRSEGGRIDHQPSSETARAVYFFRFLPRNRKAPGIDVFRGCLRQRLRHAVLSYRSSVRWCGRKRLRKGTRPGRVYDLFEREICYQTTAWIDRSVLAVSAPYRAKAPPSDKVYGVVLPIIPEGPPEKRNALARELLILCHLP